MTRAVPSHRRRRGDPWVLVFTLALLVRAILTGVQLAGRGDALTVDGCYYLQLAKNLLAGRGFTLAGIAHTVFPPGLPLAIAAVNRFVPDVVRAGQLLSVGTFFAAAALLYLVLVRTVRSRAIAALAGVLYLFAWPLLGLSVEVASEPLFALLFVAQLALVVGLLRASAPGGVLRLAAIGATGAAMFLTRPEGLLVFGAGALAILALVVRRRLRWPVALVAPLVFVLGIAPYAVFMHSATGAWRLSGKAVAWLQSESVEHAGDSLLWERNSYQLTPGGRYPWIDSSAGTDVSPAGYLSQHRSELVHRVLRNAWSDARLLLLHFGLLLLLLPFAFAWARERAEIGYLGLLFALSFYLLLFSVTGRYWSGNLPAYVLLFAVLADRAAESLAPRGAVTAAFGLAIAVNAAYGWHARAAELAPRPASRAVIAGWIGAHVPAGEPIVARSPVLPFLGGREWIRFPWFEDAGSFASYLRRNHLRWFLVTDDERRLRPFVGDAERRGALATLGTIVATFPTEAGPAHVLELAPEPAPRDTAAR